MDMKEECKENKMEMNNKEKPFECQLCGKTYRTNQLLELHKKYKHRPAEEVRIHKCDTCNKGFITKQEVRRHTERVHEKVKHYSCDKCDRKYFELRDLQNHVASFHENIKKFECNFCEKAFATKSCVNSHVKSNHEKKKYTFVVSVINLILQNLN